MKLNYIKEDVEYTDIVDAVYDQLKRKYNNDERFVDISIVKKPRRAIRVETEKDLGKGNLYSETRYILQGNDNVLTIISENDKPIKFIDVEAVLNFFDEYINESVSLKEETHGINAIESIYKDIKRMIKQIDGESKTCFDVCFDDVVNGMKPDVLCTNELNIIYNGLISIIEELDERR